MHRKSTMLILVAVLLTGCGAGNRDSLYDRSNDNIIQIDERNAISEAYPIGTDRLQSDIEHAIIEHDHLEDTQNKSRMIGDTTVDCNVLQSFPKTNITLADDGTELLYESYDDVAFKAQDPGLDMWVNSQLEEIQQNYQDNSSNLLKNARAHYQDSNDTFYTYSNYLSMDVARHDNRVLSVLAVNSVYSGGAHPVTLQSSYNLDMVSKQCLKLEDVITESSAGEMYRLVLSGLQNDFTNLGGGILYEDYMETIHDLMKYGHLTPYWYLNHNGLVIYFNQYEIASYAAGIIKVEIPYNQLDGILRDEYFPEDSKNGSGDLIVRGELENCQKISVQIGEGSPVAIGTDGTVYQVRLSDVTWLNDMPVSQKLLLSLNEMGQEDVIEITGELQDSSHSLSIEYHNGANESKTYYIRNGELSEKP